MVSVPENLLFALREDLDTISTSMQREYAIKLFQDGRLTLVQSAEFANLDIYDFTALLASRDIPVIDYSVDDLDRELKANKLI
jgi:predicted HTH domain antitoxin